MGIGGGSGGHKASAHPSGFKKMKGEIYQIKIKTIF
jgi:hypothetical protein